MQFSFSVSWIAGRFLSLLVACLGIHSSGWRACADSISSADASVECSLSSWRISTTGMDRLLVLEDGRFFTKSWVNRKTGLPLHSGECLADEFFFTTADGRRIGSGDGGWELAGVDKQTLKQGEIELSISLVRENMLVRKVYVIHPGSSVVRERCTITNRGETPLQVINPGFLSLAVRADREKAFDFHWMTGAENQAGCWTLKTEPLNPGGIYRFDSYDAFPASGDIRQYPGDGTEARILHNGEAIWPKTGWKHIPNADRPVTLDLKAKVREGDKLEFVVGARDNDGWDATVFAPLLTFANGDAYHDETGESASGWQFQMSGSPGATPLVFDSSSKRWRNPDSHAPEHPFVDGDIMHPARGKTVARIWTARRSGNLHITGTVTNTGNQVSLGKGRGFKMGSSAYAPWAAIFQRDNKQGVFIGWDYMGHWSSAYTRDDDGVARVGMHVEGYRRTLQKGESIDTPSAFSGLFQNDLDEAGNECLDWQYAYLWDYTRDEWFAKIRVMGEWSKGTIWGKPGAPWAGGSPDWRSIYLKVFRVADLIRSVGGDVYHRDWGWWDVAGDWNGPDFRSTSEYLRKSGIGQLIYAFLYTVDIKSRVAHEKPEWILNDSTLDMSRASVRDFILSQLDQFMSKWGVFEWRNDSNPMSPKYGDDTPMLAQDQGFRAIIRTFLDRHKDASFQAVNSGGNGAGYEYLRLTSTLQFSDGAVGPLRNYYASLLFPPDKIHDIFDSYLVKDYSKATWRGLLCSNFGIGGDGWNDPAISGVRELISIYHYLLQQGVVGRWTRVFRPGVTGDNPSMYFQRMSRDSKRGIIIPKHQAPGELTIRPRGLLAEEIYSVSFHENSTARFQKSGAELMRDGITLAKMEAGELIYFNLPLHPGSGLDTQPPTPPTGVTKCNAENMGFPGVEIRWSAGTDENFLAGYEVFRNGSRLDIVAKGHFYFDHKAGADISAQYEVRSIDGSDNHSAFVAAVLPEGGMISRNTRILDDAEIPKTGYKGSWKQTLESHNVTHGGTMTSSQTLGDSCEVEFEGSEVLWFSRLGADCGMALVQIDDLPAETVDTYAADEIPGVCVYRKTLPPGRHRIKISVSGIRSERSSGTKIHVDGFRFHGG